MGVVVSVVLVVVSIRRGEKVLSNKLEVGIMQYLDDLTADDLARGVVGGLLLPAAVNLVSWHPNNGLDEIFNFGTVFVFFIGFILGTIVSYGWRDGLRFLLPTAVIPILAGFLLQQCLGACILNYRYFHWISLSLVYTSYIAVILYRNRETVMEFLKGGKGGIHRDINWSLGIGILYFAVFLILNTMIRWTAVLDSFSSSLTYIIFSLGLVPTVGISVWLYMRENLKTPLLVHIPWIAYWANFIIVKVGQIPIGEFYTYSYILPNTDYTWTWPMLLSLVLISGLIEANIGRLNNRLTE